MLNKFQKWRDQDIAMVLALELFLFKEEKLQMFCNILLT